MNQHKLTLMGGEHDTLRVSAALLQEAIGALIEGARLATRFALEGESVRKGPRPAWLEAACSFDITALTAGSASLTLEAPTLSEVDAARGAQSIRVEDSGSSFAEHTAIDLFGQVLASLVDGQPDDVVADRALLDACVRFAKLSGGGLSGVSLEGLRDRASALVITPAHAPQIERLRDATPPPQAARVTGTLDTISASHADIILKLTDGTRLLARMEQHDPATLSALFGRSVVVSGMAHYRPAGRLLRLDVEAISEAGPGDNIFEAAPVAHKPLLLSRAATQDATSGVAALFGTWPGDESDEALLDALEAIR